MSVNFSLNDSSSDSSDDDINTLLLVTTAINNSIIAASIFLQNANNNSTAVDQNASNNSTVDQNANYNSTGDQNANSNSKVDQDADNNNTVDQNANNNSMVDQNANNNCMVDDQKELCHNSRPKFRHEQTLKDMYQDYLGKNPTYDTKTFESRFRISRISFQKLMEDFKNLDNKYYNSKTNSSKLSAPSLEVKLLLPLKIHAYKIPHYCCNDYFQMSATMSKECVSQFDDTFQKIYNMEYRPNIFRKVIPYVADK